MGRKKQAKLLFDLKVLMICGTAIFTIKGIEEFYADVCKEEEAEEIEVMEERMTAEPETEEVQESQTGTERNPEFLFRYGNHYFYTDKELAE